VTAAYGKARCGWRATLILAAIRYYARYGGLNSSLVTPAASCWLRQKGQAQNATYSANNNATTNGGVRDNICSDCGHAHASTIAAFLFCATVAPSVRAKSSGAIILCSPSATPGGLQRTILVWTANKDLL